MLTLIKRVSVFDQFPRITNEIAFLQKLMFDKENLELCETREEAEVYQSYFDLIEVKPKKLKRFYSVIGFEHTTLSSFTRRLSKNIITLLNSFEISSLIIISDFKINFFGNLKNKYRPLKNAYLQLQKLLNTDSYDEALSISISELPNFITIFFWLERCDPSVPEYIFFHDIEEKLSFSICKHGNLHVIEHKNQILNADILSQSGFNDIETTCNETFSKSGRIKGRILTI